MSPKEIRSQMCGVPTKTFIKIRSAAAVMGNVRKYDREENARPIYKASV
jgi:hypothetical protein